MFLRRLPPGAIEQALAARRIRSEAALHLLLAFCILRNFLSKRPSTAMPNFIAIAMSEMVGGPPINTGMPFGTASTTEVGSSSDFGLVCGFFRIGEGMPMSWQLSAGRPSRDAGSPSKVTVLLPMKISHSLAGGLTNTPPMGTCAGIPFPPVPAVPRIIPLTITVPPMIGAYSIGSITMPTNGCGTGIGGTGPGGWIMWMSIPTTGSKCVAAIMDDDPPNPVRAERSWS